MRQYSGKVLLTQRRLRKGWKDMRDDLVEECPLSSARMQVGGGHVPHMSKKQKKPVDWTDGDRGED